MSAAQKSGLLSSVLGPFTGADVLRTEKARLEAFLDAVPGEYCGFAKDGSVIYSEGFCTVLGLQKIASIHDIQEALDTADAAALEGQFLALQEGEKTFSLNAASCDKIKTFRISGSQGQALDGGDQFDIIWIEDITKERSAFTALKNTCEHAEREVSKFQTALDTPPVPLTLRGESGEILWCNQAHGKLLGLTPAGVIAQQKEISLRAKDKTGPKDLAKSALTKGQPEQMEAHVIVEGTRHHVQMMEIPLPAFRMTLGMTQDITREEELEQELSRYVAANKKLLEQLGTAIGIFGPDHSLEFFNSAFEQLWGLEDQWLNTRPKLGDILEKLRESRRLPEQADFRKYKQDWLDMFTRLIDPHEDMLHLPDGSALRMLAVPHPMGGLMMTFEDVTSRLALESSYNTLIAVQKETLDNLAEGVAVFGGDGRLKLWNPSFGELWGFNPENLDGDPHIAQLAERMAAFFDTEEVEDRRAEIVGHALERKIQDGRMNRSNDTLLEFATVPLPDGGVLVSYFDVTDTARVENALREKNAALEAAEQLKTDFLANVSYQLRTPLSTIMGFADILDHEYFGELNTRQKEYAIGIQDAGSQLLNLIDDILDLSTIEAGYLELEKTEFSIHEMLQGLHELTQDWARKEKLEVALKCPKNIGNITADERRVKQVLLNLIRNAINFTPEGGRVSLTASRKKDHVELHVSDTGIGIPEDQQMRIFEPFEHSHADPREAGESAASRRGAGLGLSLVKNIVEIHGGRVCLESAENEGTTFSIHLPL